MGMPDEKTLAKIRKKLETVEPTYGLPENATKAQKIKYKLCEKFVVHILKTGTSQAELSRKLGIDTARLNEIVKYRIDLFTIDKLVDYAELLDPSLNIDVA
jgi:predicted XRE-type DNA-binding protein